MSSSVYIDQKARDMAQAATSRIQSHEAECAIRWAGTMDTLREIKRVLAWAAGSIATSMVALICWLATHPPH